MLERLIGMIVFIPLHAVILWVLCSLGVERQSYVKALITTAIIFITIFLLGLLNFKGFHASILIFFFQSGYFKIIFSFLVLRFVYKFDWRSLIIIQILWFVIQIPINIMQIKLMAVFF